MNSFKQAAAEVLKRAGEPLHYARITELALEWGLLETNGATPEMTMSARLSTDAKKKHSAFKRVGPGVYDLSGNQTVEKVEETPETPAEKAIVEKLAIDSGCTGKAGEHAVCAELLFLGYNASIMSVDTGLDIIATKDNKLFGIQVKTSNINRFNIFVFDIRKVSFDRHGSGNVYYVFVLHGEEATKFVVLPYHVIEQKVRERAILPVSNGTRYRVNIKIRDGKVYLGNMEHDVTSYLVAWDLLK